jgi:hypothetical protein
VVRYRRRTGPTTIPRGPDTMTNTYDSTDDFTTAVSLLAALEGRCLSTGSSAMLPYLGMARAELTDYGQRLPGRLEDISDVGMHDGLERLDELLGRMLSGSPDLTTTLRLHAARQILREGLAR